MRSAVLVLGMHRSGTSALAGALTHLGVAGPRTPLPPDANNERGYFESLPIVVFHDAFLSIYGSDWSDFRPLRPASNGGDLESEFIAKAHWLLETEFPHTDAFVLKDPRMCRFAQLWLKALNQAAIAPRIIIPFRPPVEVANSLRARNNFSETHGLLLWLRSMLDAERVSRGFPRAFVSFRELLQDWRATLGRVAKQLEFEWPARPIGNDARADEIDAFLSQDLRHQRTTPDAEAASWPSRVYEALSALSLDPKLRIAENAMDAVYDEFEHAYELFGPMLTSAPAEVATPTVSKAVPSVGIQDIAVVSSQLEALRKELDELLFQTASKVVAAAKLKNGQSPRGVRRGHNTT